MRKDTMKDALDDFILRRINDCSSKDNRPLQSAYDRFYRCIEKLSNQLSEEQKLSFVECENAYSLLEGEIINCFYRAGFSDGVSFFTRLEKGE